MNTELKNYIADLIQQSGLHLVDISARKQGDTTILEVFADSEEGIAADELANTSRTLAEVIEENELLQGRYTLVLSSPGLDRPLLHNWQFSRHKGRLVKVTYQTTEKSTDVSGIIVDNNTETVTLDVESDTISIPHSSISNAEIIIKL